MTDFISNTLTSYAPQVHQTSMENVSSTEGTDSLTNKSMEHIDTKADAKATSRNQKFFNNIGKHLQNLAKSFMDTFTKYSGWFMNLFNKNDGSVSNNLPKSPSMNNVFLPGNERQSNIDEEFLKGNNSIKTQVSEARIELQSQNNQQRQVHIRNSCKALNQISKSFSEDINKVDNMISKLENGMNGIVDDGAVQLFGEMDISQRDSLDIDHEDERLSQHRSKTEEDFTDHASKRNSLDMQRNAIERKQESFEKMKQDSFEKVKRNSSERLNQNFEV